MSIPLSAFLRFPLSEGVGNLFFPPFTISFQLFMKQEGTASGLVVRNLGCTLKSPTGGGGGGRGLLKIVIPRQHPSPVTSESLEAGVPASVLFKAPWVIAMCSHVQEPPSQLESPAYSEAVVGKTKVL